MKLIHNTDRVAGFGLGEDGLAAVVADRLVEEARAAQPELFYFLENNWFESE